MDPLQQTFSTKSSRPGARMECKFNIFKCVSKLQKTYFISADLEGGKMYSLNRLKGTRMRNGRTQGGIFICLLMI